MIRHVVGFRFHSTTTAQQVTEFLAVFRALESQIPELRTLTVGPNLTDRDATVTYALEATFDDMAALDRYLTHPAHVAAVTKVLTPMLEQRVIIDLEV